MTEKCKCIKCIYCKRFHEWNLADVMDEPLDDLSPCQGCKNFSLWEVEE